MKKSFIVSTVALAFSALTIISCKKDAPVSSETAQVETTADGQVYVLDSINSKLEWRGFKVFKTDNTSHFGTIRFESGELTAKDSILESGKFVADMNSLENVDLASSPEDKAKLEGHLKSGDFFQVDQYPTASYEITKVTPLTEGDYNTLIDGNLTMRGITKPVSFKANVTVNESQVTIASEPTDIMREDFGVKFQVPVANGMIKNEINVQFLVNAMAKN